MTLMEMSDFTGLHVGVIVAVGGGLVVFVVGARPKLAVHTTEGTGAALQAAKVKRRGPSVLTVASQPTAMFLQGGLRKDCQSVSPPATTVDTAVAMGVYRQHVGKSRGREHQSQQNRPCHFPK